MMSENDEPKTVSPERALEMAEMLEACAAMFRSMAYIENLKDYRLSTRAAKIIRQGIGHKGPVWPVHARRYLARYENLEDILREPSVGRKAMREMIEFARL